MISGLHSRLFDRSTAAGVGILTFILAVTTGMHYVSRAFETTQPGAPVWLHFASAAAIELGVLFVGLTLAIRSAEGDRNLRLYFGVLLFVGVSMVANFDAAASAILGGALTWPALQALDGWTLTKAGVLGGAVPLMVLTALEALRELAASGAPTAVVPRRSRRPVAAAVDTLDDDIDTSGKRGTPSELVELVMADPTLTPAELSRLLGTARGTVYAWARRQGLERDDDGRWLVD